MSYELTTQPKAMKTMRIVALLLGFLGLVFGVMQYTVDPAAFFAAYLVAFMFCLGPTVGAGGLWMLHNLVGGRWGEDLAGTFRAATMLLPVMALAFLPIASAIERLYPWAQPAVVEASELLRHKLWYLNASGFYSRALLFFLAWGLFAGVMHWLSRRRSGNEAMRRWSAVGIIAYGLTITFASIDWVMSLEPVFVSTIFGLMVLVGQIGSVFALGILVTTFWSNRAHLQESTYKVRDDLANFLLMSVLLWAYMSFSQLILIWSGQLPEEILFYNYRFVGGWQWIGIMLVVIHFALPAFLLLFRHVKKARILLASVAIVVIVGRWLDLVWLVQPNFSPGHLQIPWTMVILPLGFAFLWLGAFLFLLERPRHG